MPDVFHKICRMPDIRQLPDAGLPDIRQLPDAGLPDFLPVFRPKKAPLLRKAILHKKARVMNFFKSFELKINIEPSKDFENIRVGPDIRQCRIIRPDFSFCRISGMPDYPASGIFFKKHPASGKKNRSGPTLINS